MWRGFRATKFRLLFIQAGAMLLSFPVAAQFNTAFYSRAFAPIAFSFVDQSDVATNTVVTSNSVVLSGIGARAVSAVCTGCTLERNGSGVWSSSIDGFRNGDQIRIRLTSSASGGTTTNASVTVGATTSSTWSVTTSAPALPLVLEDFESMTVGSAPSNGWTIEGSVGNGPMIQQGGIDGTKFMGFMTGAGGRISKTVDLTGYSRLKASVFAGGSPCGAYGIIMIMIDDDTIYTNTSAGNHSVDVDISGYSGNHLVKLAGGSTFCPPPPSLFYTISGIDNVRLEP